MEKKILVIGSINTDMVVFTEKLPAPGETVLGGKFLMNGGGKGANQAVAARRLGGNVSFVGKTGDDIYGKMSKQLLDNEGIDTANITVDYDNASGVAMIVVDEKGENSIVVAPGSNSTLSVEDIDTAGKVVDESDIILLQLEIPLEAVVYATGIASEKGKKVILNHAPARSLPDKLLQGLYAITPNETETKLLTGIPVSDINSATKAAALLKTKGVDVVVITMGAKGAFLMSDEYTGLIEAPSVKTVDSTAAGDTFNGAFAVALTEGMSLPDAVKFATRAASISVTREGAQSSIPYRKEIF